MKAWVSLSGTATLVEDRALVERLWSKGADMFMEGGPGNPDNVDTSLVPGRPTSWE